MADLDQLLEEFSADYEAGRPVNVAALLERVSPGERQELAEQLDHYLMNAPRRRWDPAAYEDSLAKSAVDAVYQSIEGVSGTWPELLPHLRNQARIKRSEVVRRLAETLGFTAEPEVEKIGSYYHEMERGLLPAQGVSERVLAALAGVVGSTVEVIRAAGARDSGEGAGGAVFARTAFPDAEFLESRLPELADADMAMADEPARDEIDALFLDG